MGWVKEWTGSQSVHQVAAYVVVAKTDRVVAVVG